VVRANNAPNAPNSPIDPSLNVDSVIYIGYGPQSATLNASTTGGSGFTYQWTANPNNPATPIAPLSDYTSPSPIFFSQVPGNYRFTVTITNNFGCQSECTVDMCVRDIRVPTLLPQRGQTKVWMCQTNNQGGAIQATASEVPGRLATNYRLGSCEMTPCFGPAGPVQFPGKAIGADGDQPSIADLTEATELSMTVFPNPSTSDFKVVVESNTSEVADVRVLDLSGRVIERLPATPTNVEVTLGAKLAPGVYFIEVSTGSDKKMVKVVKQ
jgi:hypothetical protein